MSDDDDQLKREQKAYGSIQKMASGERVSKEDVQAITGAATGSALLALGVSGLPATIIVADIGILVDWVYDNFIDEPEYEREHKRMLQQQRECMAHPPDESDPRYIHGPANGITGLKQYPAGSFEEAAQLVAANMYEAQVNCRSILPIPLILKAFADQWNEVHEGPYQLLVGTPGASIGSYQNADIFAVAMSGWPNTDMGPVRLNVNRGPLKPKTSIKAKVRKLLNAKAPASTSSTASKVATGAVVTSGVVVGGSAIYALATKQSFVGLWGKWLKKAKSLF